MNDLQTESEVSVTQLLNGIITDAQKLIKQQLTLLRHEVKEDLHKTKEAGLSLISGTMIVLVGCILLSFMLVELLAWTAPALPLWVSYGTVGAPITVLGVALFCAGVRKLNSINPLPDQTVQALKETVRWKTNPR
jgi:Putative Actinobacterial Holin-X, holin superfamily III